MATLAPQKAKKQGTAVALVAASAGGDLFPWAPNRALRVKNASGGSINVTIAAQKTCNQGVLHDNVVAVAAGAEETIGGLERSQYVDDSGYVHVAYSASASVTVAVVET